jgi:DNA processing protein
MLQRRASHVDGEELLSAAQRRSIDYVCPDEPGWPRILDVVTATLAASDEAVQPPLGIWFRGDVDLSTAVTAAIAIVGARNATRYGERVSCDLGADLATAGWTVVSGAAYGIDAAAHRGALALGGTTVAVVAGGVDVPYPKAHATLLDRIAAHGVVMSEVPPGTRPMRSRFLSRNRLIAALAAGTVVVEAGLRSGALSTAGWAHKLSREVLAVPGPVTSTLSAGCHKLIREQGAVMVTNAHDVLDAVTPLGTHVVPPRRVDDRPFDRLSQTQQAVHEAMFSDRPSTLSTLTATTGMASQAVREALIALVAGGWVVEGRDGWWLWSAHVRGDP